MRMVSAAGGALAAGLMVVAASGAAVASPNLVANGSFESGFSGWSVTYSDTASPPVVIQTGQASGFPTGAYGEAIAPDTLAAGSPDGGGDHVAYFSSDWDSETLTQTVFLGPGQYRIGFDLYVPANGDANPYDALFSGSIAGKSLLSASMSAIAGSDGVQHWVNVSDLTSVAAVGDYTVGFTFQGLGYPAKDIAVDRVFVSAVPEPATLALLGTSLLGLLAVRRQRPGRVGMSAR